MEHRQLGRSGLMVPALSLGTATFGGSGEFFKLWGSTQAEEARRMVDVCLEHGLNFFDTADVYSNGLSISATFGGSGEFFKLWGSTQAEEARRMVDVCLEHGLNFFDTADVYSNGLSEQVLGEALKGRRNQALISSKGTFGMGSGPNEVGSSRYHITRAVEDSLRRLGTDHIDLYFMHAFDALTPVEETLRALDDLISSGKIGYIGASNFSGWHLMKALATSEKYG